MSTPENYQTVTLALSDGTRATYTGRAQIDDPEGRLVVIEVVISKPTALPHNCSFQPLTEIVHEEKSPRSNEEEQGTGGLHGVLSPRSRLHGERETEGAAADSSESGVRGTGQAVDGGHRSDQGTVTGNEKDFGSAEAFHAARRMWAFYNGNLLIAKAGDTRDHKEWLKHVFTGGILPQRVYQFGCRGYVLGKEIHAYRCGRSEFDERVSPDDLRQIIPDLVALCDIWGGWSLHLGAVPGKVGTVWKAVRVLGNNEAIQELLSGCSNEQGSTFWLRIQTAQSDE